MSTAIIVVLLTVICILAVKSYCRRLSSGCCGGGRDALAKKRKATKAQAMTLPLDEVADLQAVWGKTMDHNKSDYPYGLLLTIDGMVCSNCARRAEHALNRLEGVWAVVDLEKQQAVVWMKRRYSSKELQSALKSAGYTLLQVQALEGGAVSPEKEDGVPLA